MSSVQHYLLRKQIALIQHPNIFMTQHDIDESQLYRDGKIVPYYVVGKPEIIDKRLNKSQPIEEIIQVHRKIKPTTYKEFKNKQSQQLSVQEEAEFIQIDMEPSQVENEIQQILNRKTQQQYLHLKKLSKADQAVAAKDDRIIKQFENQQQKWQRRVVSSAQQCNRPITQSIYNQIQVERERVEDKKLLEIIQTDAERYGNKLWERQLRSSSDAVEQHKKIKEQGHEIIKNPHYQAIYKRPRSIAQRFEERKDKVNEVASVGQQLDNLQIEGENKLVKETQSVQKMLNEHKIKDQNENNVKRKNPAIFKKIVPVDQVNGSYEIISLNYDKQVLRQKGKLDIFKQFF
ncbi:unnamed protein product [Paramecium primaurelia]|uniref:Uncharacterized protein n=1 Tax=Paramecium primaurelia TaxID=5886 RepID=A0A8S1QLS0_PARPR|nr:unnamed protein product [Paramecium primaurelia]